MCISGFPGTSADKESSCNAGDPGLIPGLGRAPGEGIGYPIQYFGAFLVAQMVKNPPATWETWIQFDPWVGKFPWRRGHGSPLQFSGLENLHGQRSLAGYSPQGCRVGNNWTPHSMHSYILRDWNVQFPVSIQFFKIVRWTAINPTSSVALTPVLSPSYIVFHFPQTEPLSSAPGI